MFDDYLNVVLDEGAKVPTRAHETDAGLDLYSMEEKVIPAHGSAEFNTGVHVELPKVAVSNGLWTDMLYTVGLVTSKSGLNFKHDLTCDGTIDYDYTGAIRVKLYNNGDRSYLVNKGDKIAQLVIMPILTPKVRVVGKLKETDRGDGGFGSTGR